MERREYKGICLLLAVIMLAIGCGPKHARKHELEAYLIPDPSGFGQEKFIMGLSYANRVMDSSEGGDGRISWPVFVFDEDGKHREYLATDYSELDPRFWPVWFDNAACMKRLVILLPATELGKRFVILARAGDAIFNIDGREAQINPYADIDYKKYRDFMSVVTLDNKAFLLADQNSGEAKVLKAFLARFHAPVIREKLNYSYTKYGTNHTRQEWDRIAELDDTVRSLKEWAGRDWYAIIGIPLVSVETRLIQMSIIKLIRIPEAFSKVNRPGYGTYTPNARFTAGMIERFMRLYGACINKQ